MADEQHGLVLDVFPQKRDALLGEMEVADREDLVQQQDVGFQVDAGGERQAHDHAGGVRADRLVDEVADLGEFDDAVDLRFDLGFLHAARVARRVDVLTARVGRVDPAAEFEQRGHPAVDEDPAARRVERPGDDLEQRALAAAVHTHDAHTFALADLERERTQRGERVLFEPEREQEMPEQFLPRGVARVVLADFFQTDHDFIRRHRRSASSAA